MPTWFESKDPEREVRTNIFSQERIFISYQIDAGIHLICKDCD